MDAAHNVDLYFRGKGILSFDREDEDGLPTGLRDLGNAPSFELGATVESEKHYSAREGVKTVDKEDDLSRELGGSFSLEEYDVQNLKMALLADAAGFQIRPLTASNVQGKLDLWGTNDQGMMFHVQVWKAKIKPVAKLGFISEGLGSIGFEFTAQNDEDNHADCPYALITPIGES
jgi:hypothetical protein